MVCAGSIQTSPPPLFRRAPECATDAAGEVPVPAKCCGQKTERRGNRKRGRGYVELDNRILGNRADRGARGFLGFGGHGGGICQNTVRRIPRFVRYLHAVRSQSGITMT